MRTRTMLLATIALASAAPAQTGKPDAAVTFTYPPQVRAIPALQRSFDRDESNLRAGVQGQAAADRRDAARTGRPFQPYQSDRTWKVVTDTPRFLSLSLELYDFAGGAHGNSGFGALVWDRAAGTRLTPLSFFTSKAALTAALQPDFCRQLDAERRQKRGGAANSAAEPAGFNQCLDPTEQTVILGSSTRQRFDRIGILIAPYNAGPYVEGEYEVTLPVTPAVLAAVKPQWRGYFAVKPGSRGTP